MTGDASICNTVFHVGAWLGYAGGPKSKKAERVDASHQDRRQPSVQKANFLNVNDAEKQRQQSGKRYSEFLRVSAMSAGIYVLPAGGVDIQSPHKEDEMYYVVRGQARMRAGSEDEAVSEGSIIFVAAGVEHRFYEITEELMMLVFFAPAESEAG
jgi:mannose-6-phosphate isomerase-like protein (cupin superfamily)